MFRVFFKRETCIGCGNCADVLPEYWDIDNNDGMARLLGAGQHGEQYILEIGDDDILEDFGEAENSCPLRIIRISKK